MNRGISFVLVEPAVPENIGAAARAINTMGFNELILVNPCDHLSTKARMLAHGSVHILENAKVFSSLKDILAEFSFSIATSAKSRSVKNDVYNIKQSKQIVMDKGNAISNIAIIFGREESGLTNEEIQMCDLVTSIPLSKPYPSLNLGQAVMLYAYEFSSLPSNIFPGEQGNINTIAFRQLKNKMQKLLADIDLEKNPALFHRVLERISLLSEKDIHLFHSILDRIEKNKI